MYVFAASEVALVGSSYWASLFDLDDMFALEYAADLKVRCLCIPFLSI